jgi:hypothetical protein
MREGIPYANTPIGTPIDTGTHPTCSADVQPIPCCTNQSVPTGLGSIPTALISDRAARTVHRRSLLRGRRICKRWSKTARWNEGPVRASACVKQNRARAGMGELHEPAPASKKRHVLECGKIPPVPASMKRYVRGNACRIRRVNNHVTRRYLYRSLCCRNSALHRKIFSNKPNNKP